MRPLLFLLWHGFLTRVFYPVKHGLKTRATVGALALGVTVVAWGQNSTTPQSPKRRESYSERYGILAERNIFVRDRSRPRDPESTQATTQQSARSAEELLVLTGVVLEEEGFRAYAEHQETFRVSKLAVGDAIALGKITSIDIDAVEYERNGQRKWIVIGHDFTGKPAALSAVTTSVIAEEPTTGPASTQPVLNGPNLSAEQKMKLRRQMELRH